MELHFQQPRRRTPPSTSRTTKFKGRARAGGNKFVGVRQRASGRWVAEIKDTTKKIRMWLGTFETAEEAARAYDEAACLLRGSNTRTNFITPVSSSDSPIASRIRNLLNLEKQNDDKSSRRPPTTNTPENTSASACTVGSNDDEKRGEPSDEEVYRPRFVNEDHDRLDFSNSGSDGSWAFESGLEIPFFDGFELGRSDCLQETIVSELDVMKVERQISASLYAMNGVHEYLDAINDSSDSLWDLPPLYHGLCRS